MADKPINKLPAATTVYDTDLFVLDQGGMAKKMTGEMFRKYFLKVAGGHGGVTSIAKVSSAGLVDTYRITYADGTTYDFQVHNGKSIVSVEKTDSLFLTDTYTITYNDGTTSEFYVQNGTNAEIDIKYAASTSDWVNTGEWSDRIPTYNAVDKYLWAQITITNGLDITRTEGIVGVYGEDAYESAKKGGFEGTKEEFEKKLAEGLVSEERVNELIEENAPDWNANVGEPGYIENRTHYEGKTSVDGEIPVFTGVTPDAEEWFDTSSMRYKKGYYIYSGTDPIPSKGRIIIGGEAHYYTATSDINSTNAENRFVVNGYEVVMVLRGGDGTVGLYMACAEALPGLEYAVYLDGFDCIKKLDAKYLPMEEIMGGISGAKPMVYFELDVVVGDYGNIYFDTEQIQTVMDNGMTIVVQMTSVASGSIIPNEHRHIMKRDAMDLSIASGIASYWSSPLNNSSYGFQVDLDPAAFENDVEIITSAKKYLGNYSFLSAYAVSV